MSITNDGDLEMSEQSSTGNIPVWDGNREKLPELNTLFLYKDRRYLSFKVKGNLRALDTEKEKYSPSMIIRMAGAKSDISIANILIKVEVATAEEVADIFANKDEGRLHALLEKFANLIKKLGPKKAVKIFKSKGVTDSELDEMHNTLFKAHLSSMILGSLFD